MNFDNSLDDHTWDLTVHSEDNCYGKRQGHASQSFQYVLPFGHDIHFKLGNTFHLINLWEKFFINKCIKLTQLYRSCIYFNIIKNLALKCININAKLNISHDKIVTD